MHTDRHALTVSPRNLKVAGGLEVFRCRSFHSFSTAGVCVCVIFTGTKWTYFLFGCVSGVVAGDLKA